MCVTCCMAVAFYHIENTVIKGIWSPKETLLHINVLEMRAVRLALSSMSLKPQLHVFVSTDNTSVVAYINQQGGTRSWSRWEETVVLFKMLQERSVTLRVVHIFGLLNLIADMLSREGQISLSIRGFWHWFENGGHLRWTSMHQVQSQVPCVCVFSDR